MIRITDNTNEFHGADTAGILSYAAGKLGIQDADLTVFVNDYTLDKLSTADAKLQALIYEGAPGKYVLLLRSDLDGDLSVILCHEAVHLSQYLAGRLKLDMKSRIYTWEGKQYNSSYIYEDRPWEKEAFAKQWALAKGYRKTKKRCIL